MATKYEILAALLDAKADQFGDEMGWHHVTTGVLELLQANARGHLSNEELSEAIYERIADSTSVTSFDPEDELKPGEYSPETGAYRSE